MNSQSYDCDDYITPSNVTLTPEEQAQETFESSEIFDVSSEVEVFHSFTAETKEQSQNNLDTNLKAEEKISIEAPKTSPSVKSLQVESKLKPSEPSIFLINFCFNFSFKSVCSS